MEKCIYCENESVGICSTCHQPACKDHLTLLPNQERKEMFIIEGKKPLTFVAVCNECQKREQKKRIAVAISIVAIISLIGIVVIVMRLAGYWFW
jgi:hypothetical protein